MKRVGDHDQGITDIPRCPTRHLVNRIRTLSDWMTLPIEEASGLEATEGLNAETSCDFV